VRKKKAPGHRVVPHSSSRGRLFAFPSLWGNGLHSRQLRPTKAISIRDSVLKTLRLWTREVPRRFLLVSCGTVASRTHKQKKTNHRFASGRCWKLLGGSKCSICSDNACASCFEDGKLQSPNFKRKKISSLVFDADNFSKAAHRTLLSTWLKFWA